MATTKITAAINSIPGKKESLRKAFEDLQSHSSSLSSFTLQWKDLEDHLSFIEKSIESRFKALESKEIEKSTGLPLQHEKESSSPDPEASPRPELISFCVKMDGKGLRSFICENRNDLAAIRNELTAAIRMAPDPAQLVLNAMDGFYRQKSKGEKDGELQSIRRTCIQLLERVQVIAPEMKPSVRESAKKLALEWKGKIPDVGDDALEALAFLHLLASYGLMTEFKVDDVLDLLVFVSRRKQAVDLCKSLLSTENILDFIPKLNSKGKQVDAVKFVYAFNLLDKYPPVPLLKSYLKDSKKAAQEIRKKGNHSSQAENQATEKDLSAVRAVIKAVEVYKLESEFPCENLKKRITQIEQQKANKKRAAAASLTPKSQQQNQSNKRPRPSTTTSMPTVAAHPLPPRVQTQPQLGLTERTPYMGLAGSYGLAGNGSLYNRGAPSISGAPMGLGGERSPPRSYPYSSESLVGPGLYDRPGTYGGYPFSGALNPYSSSRYP